MIPYNTMKVCTSFLLFSIFAFTNSLSRIKTKEDHRTVQPVLETVADYSNEVTGDTKNLDDVNNFTATFRDKKKNLEVISTVSKVETFTDFIQETVGLLNTYEDTAFEDFFYILDMEIRKYHYTGCKFSELMQNHNTRGLLAGALKMIRENSVALTKANINEIADMLRVEVYDENVKELLDYINSLYKNTEQDFSRVLNNLKNFTKTKSKASHNDLVQAIRDGVRTILFNHYTELNSHTRRELKERIELFWEKIKHSSALNEEVNYIPERDPVGKSGSNNIKVSKGLKNKVKEHEHVFKSDPQLKFLDKRKKIGSKETYDEQSQDNEMEKDERNFVSGDVQSADTEWLKSLKMLAPVRMDMKEETTLYPKTAKETQTLPTKTKMPSPVMRAQEEIEPRVLRKPPSKYSKRRESFFRQQPNESRRHDNTRVQYLNEYVSKKINTIENELKKLKEINDLRTKMINNNTEEVDVRNVTNSNETKYIDESKRKHMTNVRKLLKNFNDLNIEELLLQYLDRHNLQSDEDKYIRSTDEVTNVTRFESDATTATVGITRRMANSKPAKYNQIVRHKDPIERLNILFDVYKNL